MKDSKAYEEAVRRVKNLPEIFGEVSWEDLKRGVLGKCTMGRVIEFDKCFIPDDAEYETLPDGSRKLPCLFYGDLYFEKEGERDAP